MQTVLYELERFHNDHVTECRKNVSNARYNAHGWLIKQNRTSQLGVHGPSRVHG